MKYLIVGLGNVGKKFEDTRHNIGFSIIDSLAKESNLILEVKRLAFFGDLKYKGRSIFLIKPTTYVNLTGKAVNYWMKYLKIPIAQILIVVDDLALPFGMIRIRQMGSHGGHNGLKNVEDLLNTKQYPRLRFGIGNDFLKGRQINYVLSKFSKDEKILLPNLLNKAKEIIFSFCSIGIEGTMNRYN